MLVDPSFFGAGNEKNTVLFCLDRFDEMIRMAAHPFQGIVSAEVLIFWVPLNRFNNGITI